MNQMTAIQAADADEPLPPTVEECDAEIEEVQDEIDDITAQIEVHDQGLGSRDEAWRRRATGALIARKKELHLLRRHRYGLEKAAEKAAAETAEAIAAREARRLQHEAMVEKQQAEKAARILKQHAAKERAEARKQENIKRQERLVREQQEASRQRQQEEHERKMERIRASNDRDRRLGQALRKWLAETHPRVWDEAMAMLEVLEASEGQE